MSEKIGARPVNMKDYFDCVRAKLRYRVRPAGPVANPVWGVETDMLRVEPVESF
ncbi:MAG: hypothetical protein IT207_08720 [Fimbriimonadaceae bacterium]|nr:hypothetical protein [Fimbriimonadaceae bacterium]